MARYFEVHPDDPQPRAFMIPIFGVTWGHVFLDEDLGSGIWAGGALILLATMLVTGFNPFQRWFGREAAKS